MSEPGSRPVPVDRKVTTRSLRVMKERGERITALTAYDHIMAELLDALVQARVRSLHDLDPAVLDGIVASVGARYTVRGTVEHFEPRVPVFDELLPAFDVELVDPSREVRLRDGLSVGPMSGEVMVRFVPR